MNDIWRLRAAAVMWLRYERQCAVVAIERGVTYGVPDVCGVTDKRRLIEIEIKQSMTDFRNNSKKWCMQLRANEHTDHYTYSDGYGALPSQFYFLVPFRMTDKVLSELPEGFGLMSLPGPDEAKASYRGVAKPIVRRNAPIDPRAKPLSIAHIRRMVKHQTGTLSSLLVDLSNFVDRYIEAKQAK